jgi:DUF438 domain-containing protein
VKTTTHGVGLVLSVAEFVVLLAMAIGQGSAWHVVGCAIYGSTLICLDLTFVDADDRIAFFSEGPNRIFVRSKAIIGRKVQHCHPPRRADTVNKILEDFRSGRQNVAEFWIRLRGKFVHIRYFAVRNAEGRYLGTVELTQDLAPLHQLSGERRLLAYESGDCRLDLGRA